MKKNIQLLLHKMTEKEIRKICLKVKTRADQLVAEYLRLRTAVVDSSPRSQVVKKIFDEAEAAGTHRRLLYAFHAAANAMHAKFLVIDFKNKDELPEFLALVNAAEKADQELAASGKQQLRRMQQALRELHELN